MVGKEKRKEIGRKNMGMNKGKITLNQIAVTVECAYVHIVNLEIDNKENTHGKMILQLEMPEETSTDSMMSLKGSEVAVQMPDDSVIFSGVCSEISILEQAGYKRLSLEVKSSTFLMDQVKYTETFQSPSKHLHDIVDKIAQKYNAIYGIKDDPSIATVIYQKDETDWAFLKRLANQYKQFLYADIRSLVPRFFIGTGGLKMLSQDTLLQRTSTYKDIDELRSVKGNVDGGSASYQYQYTECLCEDLTLIPGDIIGQYTIKSNHIVNNGGILENHILVSKTRDTLPAYEMTVSKLATNGVLTGTVIDVIGNMLQVQLDTDTQDMKNNCVEIPYESPISNSFYCMPDIGDTVYIYYENNGKMICLGSKRNNTDHEDFQNYKEKSLTSYDKMVRFTDNALKLTATRKKHDAKDDTEISIILDDEEGITITSGRDITLDTQKGLDIVLSAVDPDSIPQDLIEALKNGQEKFLQRASVEYQKYINAGGATFWNKAQAICKRGGDDLKENFVNTFTFVNLRKAVNMLLPVDMAEVDEDVVNGEPEPYTQGVVTIYGLNTVVMQVQRNIIVLDADVYIGSDAFNWLGYTKGEHAPVVEEYQDWFEVALDAVSLVLDIAGWFCPFCDVANAALSLARGDVAGALLSVVAVIPVVGDSLKTAGSTAKMLDHIDSASKVGKTFKVVSNIWSGVSYVDVLPGMGIQFYEIIEDGDFDWRDAKEWQRVLGIVKVIAGVVGYHKNYVEENKKPDPNSSNQNAAKGAQGGDADLAVGKPVETNQTSIDANKGTGGADTDVPSQRQNDGPEVPKHSSDTTSDPINVITGSLLAEYVDLSVEDLLGSFDLKRCYESAFDNRGGLLGDKWRFEIESSITMQGETATVQMPDLHMERFRKRDGSWENLHTDDKSYILSETESGFVLRKSGIATIYEYNRKGQLTGITDHHGNRTELLYEGGFLEKISLASGSWILFRYQDGKLHELEDNIGRKVSYTYADNYLHSVALPNGGTLRYEYTKEGFIRCAYDANGNWYTRNYYDRKGRVIRQELAGGEEYVVFYDDANKQNTFLTTSDGNSIIYQYGREQLANKVIYPDQTTIEKRYDAAKNVIYEKDRKGNETFRTYNEQGLVAEERFPDGLIKCYEYNVDNQMIQMSDNAGRVTIKEYDASGNIISSKVRMEKEQYATTAFTYDSKGRILSMTDSLGNTDQYFYDLPISRPTKMITSAGNMIRYSYDKAGRLMEVEDEIGIKTYGYNNLGQRIIARDEDGNVTRFYYDNMANLVKKIRPNAYNALNDDGEGTVYEYDVWENLSRVIFPDGGTKSFENDFYGKLRKVYSESSEWRYEYDADHNRIRSIYPDGSALREIYDVNGNVIKRILPQQYDVVSDDGAGYVYEYDSRNRLVQVMNPQKIVEHRYVYDIAGHLVKEIDAKGYLSAETDAERIGTLYTYNLLGFVTEVRKPMELKGDTVLYRLMAYRYDSYGNCIEEKRYLDYQTKESANGRVNCIHYSYDKANRLMHIYDSLGASVEYSYNCRNQKVFEKRKIAEGILQERHYFYSASGRIERIMDSADEKGCGRKYTPTYFTYDKNGNITCIKTASGYEVLREYDVCDRVIAEIHQDKSGKICNRSEYAYDREGRLIEQKWQDGYVVNYRYDAMGKMIEQRDSRGAIQRHEYDLNGNLVSRLTMSENGQKLGYHYIYDILDRNTDVIALDGRRLHYNCYNSFGEIEQEGDCVGGIQFLYDLAGRRIQAQTQEGSSQTYEYDAVGNIIALKDGNGNRTAYETDLWGRITKIVKVDGSIESYEYDYAGNVVGAIDGNGNRATYRYNSLNKLAARVDAAGCEETFLYDMEGRMCEHTDREGRREKYLYNLYGSPVLHKDDESGVMESWEYDSMGRLKSAIGGGMRYDYTYYQGGLLKEKKASGRVLISYEYDTLGRKTAQTDLTGKCTEYHYDESGMMDSVLENDRVLARYGYYPDGAIKSLRIDNILHTEYTYDKDKNTTGMKTMLDGEIMLVDNSYGYDGNGNRSWKQGLDGRTQYRYDFNNRLVEVQYPNLLNGDFCYEKINYDYAGNRVRRMTESLTEEYRYDNCNRLLQLQTIYLDNAREEETIQYCYDRQGNMLSDEKGEYQYDAFNRMQEFTGTEGNKQINHYDAEGLRYEMEENGRLVQFLFSGRDVVAEKESDSNIIRYIRGIGLISSDSENAKTYYHYVTDEYSSVMHLIAGDEKSTDCTNAEENGTSKVEKPTRILNSYTYDAFGNTVCCDEKVHNRFRYNGEQYDPVCQQYYLRARYYNPVISRFTQEDTYYGDGLNLYQYCANNPVRFRDPSGHGSIEQNPYKRYLNEGADPEAVDLAGQLYPDLASKRDIVKKYEAQGYKAADALDLANRELLWGTDKAVTYGEQNMTKALPDTTQIYDVNSDFRALQRLEENRRLRRLKPDGEGGSGVGSISTPNSGQGFSPNGYNPQPGERTLDGYVKNHASPEISLHTDSAGFNNNNGNVGGDFKRFGAESHGGVSPHVHQPQRNVAPNGNIYGTVGTKTANGGVTSPSKKDVKQLYEYLTNGKYH